MLVYQVVLQKSRISGVRPKATSSVVHILRSVGARGVHEQGISRLAHRLVDSSNRFSIGCAGVVSYCPVW